MKTLFICNAFSLSMLPEWAEGVSTKRLSSEEARQLVNHRHYLVNGESVNIPLYLLKAGDVVSVKDTDCEKIKQAYEANAARPKPVWMNVDGAKLTTVVNRLPERSEIDFDVQEHFIVELYSK